MNYAKLINGSISYAPNPILHNGLWYGNPPAEVYEAEGYKPVRFTDMPEPLGNGYWQAIWTEDALNIYQSWEWVEQPIAEDEALVRYSNELTGASDENLVEAAETLIKRSWRNEK